MTGPLQIVVLGLSISSSWGNGHATTYRALLNAFAARGHRILFLERDRPWYASNRDLPEPAFCRLALYDDVGELEQWRSHVHSADAVIVGSYVPDGVAAGRWVRRQAGGVCAFYDIDTPVTLAKLANGDYEYISPDLVAAYDLYLSFTGGPALQRLMRDHRSPAARPLYCSVDTAAYRPIAAERKWDLSYLGTYSVDRQPALERLLLEPAWRLPHLRFCVAGPQYPESVEWPANVERVQHVAPADHPAFYSASRFTLNVTRQQMIATGYSPSVRLFEAAACGTAIISDVWEGLGDFFVPKREIVLAGSADDVVGALTSVGEPARRTMAHHARQRVLAEHSASIRAAELEQYLRETIRQHGSSAARREREAKRRRIADGASTLPLGRAGL